MRGKLLYSGKEVALSVQHLFAMFGATVLVPLLTGLNPSVALVTAGIGTLLFHFLTKMKVPVFLGSSFAFIPAILAVGSGGGVLTAAEIPYAQGGIIVAGLVYMLLSLIVYLVGVDRVRKLLPSVVTGSIIIVIGLQLAATAISDANGANTFFGSITWGKSLISWGIALFTIAVVILSMVFLRGFFRLVPILIGLFAGYMLCIILDLVGVFPMDYSPLYGMNAFQAEGNGSAWINIPYYTSGFFSLPKFSFKAILAIAPVAIVTFMEHIGDITTNGTVVGKDFMRDPGLHRTVLGDGCATLIAGFLGGPPNTTYSENTGVLATTKNYDPRLLRLTAVFAIILGVFGKFGAILRTIPSPVKGGVEIVLFGTIAAIGIRTLAESKLDFTHSRNLLIVGAILVLGIGINTMGGINIGSFNISGLFVATVIGILLNLILPKKDDDEVDALDLENHGQTDISLDLSNDVQADAGTDGQTAIHSDLSNNVQPNSNNGQATIHSDFAKEIKSTDGGKAQKKSKTKSTAETEAR